jgi:DNA adenine methylase
LGVVLGLRPDRALLNDANPHLINFYGWLARGLTIAARLENEERAFYTARERFNDLLRRGRSGTREAAALFYYLNRTGYNGLCRFNRSGEFNVPFGQYKRIGYVTDFTSYKETFGRWSFTAGDFGAVALSPGDFVYADPPYDVQFTHYSRGGFSWDDQVRAAETFGGHEGPVVLVNQATPRICDLYRTVGYELRFLNAPRRINCTGDRTPAREVLALRNV